MKGERNLMVWRAYVTSHNQAVNRAAGKAIGKHGERSLRRGGKSIDASAPMPTADRITNYAEQAHLVNGRKDMTPQQLRRAVKKANRNKDWTLWAS